MNRFRRHPIPLARITDVRVHRRLSKHTRCAGLPFDIHLWVGAMSADGYGKMKVGGKVLTVHRIAYACYVGEIPEGMTVGHKSPGNFSNGVAVPPISVDVNPEHLELVSHGENVGESNSRHRYRGVEVSHYPVRQCAVCRGPALHGPILGLKSAVWMCQRCGCVYDMGVGDEVDGIPY